MSSRKRKVTFICWCEQFYEVLFNSTGSCNQYINQYSNQNNLSGIFFHSIYSIITVEGDFLHSRVDDDNARVPPHRLRHDARPSTRARRRPSLEVVLAIPYYLPSSPTRHGRPHVMVGQLMKILRRHGRRGSRSRSSHPRFVAIMVLESRGDIVMDK